MTTLIPDSDSLIVCILRTQKDFKDPFALYHVTKDLRSVKELGTNWARK